MARPHYSNLHWLTPVPVWAELQRGQRSCCYEHVWVPDREILCCFVTEFSHGIYHLPRFPLIIMVCK